MKQQSIDILDEMLWEYTKVWTIDEIREHIVLLDAKSRIQALWDGWIPEKNSCNK